MQRSFVAHDPDIGSETGNGVAQVRAVEVAVGGEKSSPRQIVSSLGVVMVREAGLVVVGVEVVPEIVVGEVGMGLVSGVFLYPHPHYRYLAVPSGLRECSAPGRRALEVELRWYFVSPARSRELQPPS